MDTSRQRPLKVGLFLQNHENLRTRVLPRWPELLQVAQCAESVGFDSIWLGDHLYVRFPTGDVYAIWEGWSMLTGLAATTSRMEVGTAVMCTSFRNPALLAKMAATVDEMSGGRLILGLGSGWHEPDFQAYGFPFDHRVSRFEEALTIITTLFRDGHIDFDGEVLQGTGLWASAPEGRIRPAPIVVGAGGERMMRLRPGSRCLEPGFWTGRHDRRASRPARAGRRRMHSGGPRSGNPLAPRDNRDGFAGGHPRHGMGCNGDHWHARGTGRDRFAASRLTASVIST